MSKPKPKPKTIIMKDRLEEEEKKKCEDIVTCTTSSAPQATSSIIMSTKNNDTSISISNNMEHKKSNHRLNKELKSLTAPIYKQHNPSKNNNSNHVATTTGKGSNKNSAGNNNNNNNINTTRTRSTRTSNLMTNQDPNSISLFASEFNYSTIMNTNEQQQKQNEQNHSTKNDTITTATTTNTVTSNPITNTGNYRPKRRIKQVVKYQPNTRNYKQEVHLQQLAGKCGTGFLCPGCNMHLSYDAKICWQCQLGCCYVPGTGVVVCKNRDSIMSMDILTEQEIVLNFDATDTDTNANASTSTAISVTSKKRPANLETNNNMEKPPKVLKRDKYGKFISPKSTTSSSLSTTKIATSSSSYEQYNHHDGIAECEACLRLLLSSYLQRHRKTLHNLPSNKYGCPYCPDLFHTTQLRLDHIHKKHSGKPHCLPREDKERTKVYLYNCPYCKSSDVHPMAFHTLKNHLEKEHGGVSISHVLNKLTTSCPFCIDSTKILSKRKMFITMTSLWDHLKNVHGKCDMIGRRLNIGSRDSHSNPQHNVHIYKKEGRIECENFDASDDSNGYEEDTHEVVSDEHWNELSYDSMRELCNLDRGLVKGGQTYGTLSNYIDRKLTKIKHLEQCHVETQEQLLGKIEDEEYSSENKLYMRGLRERSGKAASEALEKMTYKDECELLLRKLEYENRCKRKTPEELETNEFIHRPFHIIPKAGSGSGSKTRRGGCKIGDSCSLCNGFYATSIVTSDEIDDVGGNILNALPIICGGQKRKEIPHLNFWRVSDQDIPDDRGEAEKEKGKSMNRRSRGQGRINLNAWMEYWKLMEMKNSLLFVKEYNQGLFQQHNWAKK